MGVGMKEKRTESNLKLVSRGRWEVLWFLPRFACKASCTLKWAFQRRLDVDCVNMD